MARYRYSCKVEENMAASVGRDLPISTKQAIEICSHIRRKGIERARSFLKNVTQSKEAVPFRRFNGDVGHKKKIGPGRFPQKAAKTILGVIDNAQANAQNKGLATGKLEIYHTCAHKASTPMKRGRQGNRQMKRTHVEVVLRESLKKEKKEKSKPQPSKKAQKTEEKKEQPVEKAEKVQPEQARSEEKVKAGPKEKPKEGLKEEESKRESKQEPKAEQKSAEKTAEPQKNKEEK